MHIGVHNVVKVNLGVKTGCYGNQVVYQKHSFGCHLKTYWTKSLQIWYGHAHWGGAQCGKINLGKN